VGYLLTYIFYYWIELKQKHFIQKGFKEKLISRKRVKFEAFRYAIVNAICLFAGIS